MSDLQYKNGYEVGPFYRKFLVGDNVWCEVNKDGDGGLWLHIGNSFEGIGSSYKPVHFDSEEQFVDFCIKLKGNV